MRLLVIEDNPKLNMAIAKGLRAYGYAVDTCLTALEGEDAASHTEYDAIILDLMLPDRDGIQVCRSLRARRPGTPILILSGISGTKDKVRGLDAGADDFLVKPFEFEELLARLRALLRRGKADGADVLRTGDLEFDLVQRKVQRGGKTVTLSGKELSLLEYLMRNSGRVVTRSEIGEHVWDMASDPSSNVIDVFISSLRRKIERGFASPLIRTVQGAGYEFGVPAAQSESAG